MSAPRPLPARPSLEFERKRAKQLLRELRRSDPAATLADAQRHAAREYGFASWPKLVRYFHDAERQQRFGRRRPMRADYYESSARSLIAQHRNRRAVAAFTLASYVPRCYAMQPDDVFACTITDDEVRLAVARSNGYTSWDAMLERAEAELRRRERGEWNTWPFVREQGERDGADLDALRRYVDEHPEVLCPSEEDVAAGRTLLATAVHYWMRGWEAMGPVVDWLVARGFDLPRELDRQLCGWMGMEPAHVHWLLDRGANANAVMSNGIPVLEHAIIRYWNGDAIDVLAAHARPRRALWIAAGLGDVHGAHGVARALDRDGRPTPAARRIRPDYDIVGPRGMLSHPDPDDAHVLFEALVIAVMNGRTAVIEYLASRGVDVNMRPWDSPVLNVAVANAMHAYGGWLPSVEALLRCGADPDLVGWHPTQSAREIAREILAQRPDDARCRRIATLLGVA